MKSKKTLTVLLFTMLLSFSSGYLLAAQEHMRSALSHLNEAKDELQKANHDKGGHRVKALGLVNQAIVEVNKGLVAGKE